MAAFDPATLDRWRALAIVDRDGTTVGTISEFYLDRETGYPTWALVNTGLFGATQTFVPLVHATEISDGLQVPYEKNHIKDTPKVDLHDELSPTEEAELFAHYGVEYQPSPDTEPAEGSADPGSAEGSDSGPAGAVDPGSAEPPGPVRADAGSAGSPAVVEAGAGLVGSPAAAEGGLRASGSPAGTNTEPGPSDRSDVTDDASVTGEASGVPAEPGSVDAPGTASADAGPAHGDTVPPGPGPDDATGGPPYAETAKPGPAGPGADEAATGQFNSGSEAVPEEPGTTDPDEATLVESQRSGPYAGGSDESGLSAGHPQDQTDPDPALEQSRTADHDPDPDLERSGTAPPDLAPEPSGTAGHDPDLARTAPVEPGLPGSTAASPYGPSPTVDKADRPSEPPAEPPRAPDEAGWAPGAAGSFEEHEPFDRPAGASDRWREAKLVAERDRIARAAASEPEGRSPLERARRRLERLVGGGQDHPDPEISPADREAAERARRARLGLDEDDRRR